MNKNQRSGSTFAKPTKAPTPPHKKDNPLVPCVEGRWIWCPLKGEWRVNTPEEQVRQEYVLILQQQYGYDFAQMDQERRTKHGRRSPKADIVAWESPAAKQEGRTPVIVVECKSDNVTINPDDYDQGDSYARAAECEFLVTHNNKETRFFRVIRGLPGTREDIEDIPKFQDLGNAKRMDEIRRATKAFTREEFRQLLFDCHCILRDNHKMEPGRAFDEISKILFIKMFVERTGNHEKFTIDYLDRYADIRRSQLDEVMNDLFEDTKKHYKADDLFGKDDALQISFATFRRIVQKLQKFNLAATSDDVKGIAFEKFLGQTFRGELGQFFTPRPIVDFMVELLDPKEGEVLCDPASGSGGFLIKFFEHVRSQIEEDVQNKKHAARKLIEREELDEDAEGERLNNVFAEMNAQLDIGRDDSRLWKVAHDCIFGTDAEPRAARTSKMNMIMHGDGHGGIHHHDGFVDVNGIFPDRFNIVLTNPPFGSKVGKDQKVGTTPETKVGVSPEIRRGYEARFGDTYKASYERMRVAEQSHTPILDLYDLGQKQDSVKSEILFLERCLKLLIPGGKLGIVVPDGVLNNPSLIEVRRYLENRAKLLAVVSIPDKTFRSAKTAVKASLLFLQRLSEEEQAAYETTREKKAKEEHARLGPTIDQYELALSVTWTQYRRAQEAKVTVADSEGIRRPVRRARDTRRRTAATTARALGQQEAIAAAEKLWGCALDAETFKQSRSLARVRLRELKTEIDENVFNAVRKKYDYPIFMAVAEHVGIRGSGKTDPENELPQVAAEWRAFLKNPTKITPDVSRQVFRMNWSELDRWDPTSFRPIEWKCSPELLRPIGKILRKRIEPVSEEIDFTDLTPITIHFDGSVEQRDTSDTDEYTMELFFAQPGDIVLSKIDLKNGAVGLVPEKLKNVAVTNHFVVYEPDAQQLYPPYLIRLIQATFFKDYLWRKKVGSEGRKEVKIELFESTLIPLPDVETQKKLVEQWVRLEKDKAEIEKRIEENRKTLDPELLAGTPAQRSTEAARG